MDVLLISFVLLTSFICFFGIKIANWLSDEDSTEAPRTLQRNGRDNIYPMYVPRYQTESRHMQSFRSYSRKGARLSINSRQGSPIRHRAA